jgi:hypothetical protein
MSGIHAAQQYISLPGLRKAAPPFSSVKHRGCGTAWMPGQEQGMTGRESDALQTGITLDD